jgi:hypothetical protein
MVFRHYVIEVFVLRTAGSSWRSLAVSPSFWAFATFLVEMRLYSDLPGQPLAAAPRRFA